MEGLSKNEKGLIDMDYSVVIMGGEGIRELNGNGKNTINMNQNIFEKPFFLFLWGK